MKAWILVHRHLFALTDPICKGSLKVALGRAVQCRVAMFLLTPAVFLTRLQTQCIRSLLIPPSSPCHTLSSSTHARYLCICLIIYLPLKGQKGRHKDHKPSSGNYKSPKIMAIQPVVTGIFV